MKKIMLFADDTLLEQLSVHSLISSLVELNDSDRYEFISTNDFPETRGGLSNEVLIALIGASGAGLGAFITWLFLALRQVEANKITIKTRNGASLEVPANVDMDNVKKLIEEVNKLEQDTVQINIE